MNPEGEWTPLAHFINWLPSRSHTIVSWPRHLAMSRQDVSLSRRHSRYSGQHGEIQEHNTLNWYLLHVQRKSRVIPTLPCQTACTSGCVKPTPLSELCLSISKWGLSFERMSVFQKLHCTSAARTMSIISILCFSIARDRARVAALESGIVPLWSRNARTKCYLSHKPAHWEVVLYRPF
jgi:hypothetical protein